MRRKAAMVFIHVFVAIQLVLPVSYYAWRADRHDERFAWRMFSAERMVRCQARFHVGAERKPVRLGGEFHEAWRTMAARGRQAVIVAMARKLCADHPGKPVRVDVVCTAVDGTRQRIGGGWDVCSVGAL